VEIGKAHLQTQADCKTKQLLNSKSQQTLSELGLSVSQIHHTVEKHTVARVKLHSSRSNLLSIIKIPKTIKLKTHCQVLHITYRPVYS